VLPPDSAALKRVGSALPDLWPIVAPRPLPALVLRKLRASTDLQCADLAWGIAHHMQADAVFHGNDEFNRRTEWLAEEVRARWPGLRQASFYAHVLVEMLLDRWLMEQDPRPLDLYYQAFQPELLTFAAESAVTEASSTPSLHAVLDRFVTSQFLRTYTTAEGLARRFLGLTRTLPWDWEWQDQRPEELAEAIGPWHQTLSPGSDELIESVRVAVVVA
jgi:hypothetical protein